MEERKREKDACSKMSSKNSVAPKVLRVYPSWTASGVSAMMVRSCSRFASFSKKSRPGKKEKGTSRYMICVPQFQKVSFFFSGDSVKRGN